MIKNWKDVGFWLLFCFLLGGLINFGWVGYLASDDFAYIDGARGWAENGFYIPVNHWEVRHPLVLPLAAFIGLFGIEEIPMIAVSTLYFVAILGLLYWWLKRHYTVTCARFFLLIAATIPMSAELSGTLNVDVVEAFWCLFSIILFLEAGREHERQVTLLFLSGAAMGMAFLSRETSAGILVGYGLLFLFNKHIPKQLYFVMGAGFVAVVGVDLLVYFIATGQPLYRFDIVLGSHSVPDRATANFIQIPYLEPLGALFINNEFGLLFWFAVAAAYLLRGQFQRNSSYLPLCLVGILGLIHYVVVGYGLGLRALPRYYVLITVIAAMFVAAYFSKLWEEGKGRYRAIVGGGFLAVMNLVLVDLGDQEPCLAEKLFVRTVAENPGKYVVSDSRTCARGLAYARLAEARPDPRTVEECSDLSKADIIVYSARNLKTLYGANASSAPYRLEALEGIGEVLSYHYPADTYLSKLLSFTGVDQIIPLPQRLYRANETIAIVKVSSKKVAYE